MSDEGLTDQERISRMTSNPAGYDSKDPYADIDLDDLPCWWYDTIEEFREHDMRPYRPPRFTDGVLKHEVVDEIKREFDVEVKFLTYADDTEEWTVLLDGVPAEKIGHHRAPEGYSVYEMRSDVFESVIENRLASED